MTQRIRYYRPTVGSDFIPDRHQWLDRVLPPAIFIASLAIIAVTIWFA
ncbi:hypothetical protein [Mesorhizobium sp.]|nr:hypothetical protein [Mesorhizobium sp.]